MAAKVYRTLQGRFEGRGSLDGGKEHDGGGDHEEGESLAGEHVGCFLLVLSMRWEADRMTSI